MTYFRTGNPYYHRRAAVSRSCSGWEGVVPAGCSRQALTGDRVQATGNRRNVCGCGRALREKVRNGVGLYWRASGLMEFCYLLPELCYLMIHGYGVKPHGPLVPVSSTHYCASTPGLSTWWSATTLQGDQVPGRSHLQARFPLRCFQRLSLPYIATRRCDWRHNRYTSGTSTPVLSY